MVSGSRTRTKIHLLHHSDTDASSAIRATTLLLKLIRFDKMQPKREKYNSLFNGRQQYIRSQSASTVDARLPSNRTQSANQAYLGEVC